MANKHPQGPSSTPTVPKPQQCTGCPPGNSLPVLPGENVCASHAWFRYDNGAYSNVYDD